MKNTLLNKKFKNSKYNICISVRNKNIIYNTCSGSMAILKDEDVLKLKQFTESSIILNTENEEFLKQSIVAGFLVPLEKDEIKHVEEASWINRKDTCSRALTLTILPGLNCNLGCTYCFQNHENKIMSKEIQNSVTEYVEKNIGNTSGLHVTWYGGEPLLYIKLIENLTKIFYSICKKYNKNYTASITTNGILLTRDIAEKLKELGIKRAQITLDGPAEIHNSRRCLNDGQDTYKKILNNIISCNDLFLVRVRVNLDKTNFEHIPRLLNDLVDNKVHNKIELDLKQVVSSNVRPWDDKTLTTQEYAKIASHLYGLAIKKDFQLPIKILQPAAAYCSADKVSGIMIDPDGYLYKCTESYGKDYAIGKFSSDGSCNYIQEKLKIWIDKNPFKDKYCYSCEVLPICMGGCNLKRLIKGEDWCDQIKYNIRDYIKIIYNMKQKDKNI